MKAVVVHAAKDLRVDEIEAGTPGPGEVLVDMEWGGICGSDIAYVRDGVSGTAVLKDPLILGHEVAGRVAALGEGVDDLEIGTPVTMHPSTYVGEYEVHPDLVGRDNLWPQVRYFGSAAFQPHEHGGFSGSRVVRRDQIRVLPEGVSTKEAACAEPLGVAIHAVNQAGDVKGRTVLVNGAGPIGALCVAAAKHAGAAKVIAADLSGAALAIARQMGADETVNPSGGDALPQDVDVAIEASGAPGAIGNVLMAVRRGGKMVQVGNLPGGEVPIALGQLVTREIEYVGSYRFNDEITDALQLMADGVDVSPLWTHEYPIEEAVEAFRVAADRTTGSSKVMIDLRGA